MLECVRAKGKAGSSGAAKADAQEGVEEASGMRPRLLAMDCEMCETDREQAALVGLCVSDEKGDVLYKVRVDGVSDVEEGVANKVACRPEGVGRGGGSVVQSVRGWDCGCRTREGILRTKVCAGEAMRCV